MPQVRLNDRTLIEYEHVPIIASANVITGTKYYTKIILVNPNGSKYTLGEIDEKLDEADVVTRFTELIRTGQERTYGTQRPLLRRELTPVRQRGQVYRGTKGSILNLDR